MGCRILSGSAGACFYDSVTDVVFGPLMESEEEANTFEGFLDLDPRQYTQDELMQLFKQFREDQE